MTDEPTQAPEAKMSFQDLELMSIEEMDAERSQLLAGHEKLEELSVEELERLLDINAKIANTVRVAAKPKATRTKEPEQSLDDLFSG